MNTSDKILTFLLTSGIVGVFSFFALVGNYQNLIVGYNDRDADTGGIFLVLWIFIGAGFAGILSISKILSITKKQIKNVYSALIASALISIIIGFVINIIGLFAALKLAEIVRLNI